MTKDEAIIESFEQNKCFPNKHVHLVPKGKTECLCGDLTHPEHTENLVLAGIQKRKKK